MKEKEQPKSILVMEDQAINELQNFINEMPFKYASPLIQFISKHVKQVEDDTKKDKK